MSQPPDVVFTATPPTRYRAGASAATTAGGRTGQSASRPATSTSRMPAIPARCSAKSETKSPKRLGARNDTARPVVAYRPKNSPSRPAGARRARNVRDDDCAGPTNSTRARPNTQNISGPDTNSSTVAAAIIPSSDTMITDFGPTRSSNRPPATAPTAATTLAATPNSSTSPARMPYTPTASTDPTVKIAASPSRNSALAPRK